MGTQISSWPSADKSDRLTVRTLAANLCVDSSLLEHQIITDRNARVDEVQGNTTIAWEECAEIEWWGNGSRKLITYRNVVTGQVSCLKPFKLMTPWEKKRFQADPVWQELSLFNPQAKTRSKVWLNTITWTLVTEMPEHVEKAIADDDAKLALVVQRNIRVYSAIPNPNPHNYTSLSDTPHHLMHRPFNAALLEKPWIDYFTSRPCPYYLKITPGFLLFGRLPTEIQLLIWKWAVPEGKIVKAFPKLRTVRAVPASMGAPDVYVCGLYARYKPPAMLHTSSVSRTIALRHFVPAFESLFGRPMYFDYEKDTLQLMDKDAYDCFYRKCVTASGSKKRTFQLLRNIALPELSLGRSFPFPRGYRDYIRLNFLDLMLELEGLEFTFLFRKPHDFPPSNDLPNIPGYDGFPMTNEIVVREKGLDLASPFMLQLHPGQRSLPSHLVPGPWSVLSASDYKQPCIITLHHWQLERVVRDRYVVLEKAIIAKGQKI